MCRPVWSGGETWSLLGSLPGVKEGMTWRGVKCGPFKEKKHKNRRGHKKGRWRRRSNWEGVRYLSWERNFFCSFSIWMRGFHDLPSDKPSSLFLLSGWSSTMLLPQWYVSYVWISWPDCWYETGHSGPSLCCAQPWLISPGTKAGYANGALQSWSWQKAQFVQHRTSHTHRQYCVYQVFSS